MSFLFAFKVLRIVVKISNDVDSLEDINEVNTNGLRDNDLNSKKVMVDRTSTSTNCNTTNGHKDCMEILDKNASYHIFSDARASKSRAKARTGDTIRRKKTKNKHMKYKYYHLAMKNAQIWS